MDEAFAEVELDYTEIHDLGDRVFATGSFRTRGRQSGAVTESPVAALVDVDAASKGTRVLTYLDPKDALEAAGLAVYETTQKPSAVSSDDVKRASRRPERVVTIG